MSPVTQRTGAAGDLTALANVATLGCKLEQTFSFVEAGTGFQVQFALVAGAAAAGNFDQVAPADLNAATNNVHFARVSPVPVATYQITAASGNVGIHWSPTSRSRSIT